MDYEAFLKEWYNDSPTVLVHTSGSTGQPKPMLVEKRRMEASARITCSFLGLRKGGTALLCLPLDYIAGKMMAVRAIVWKLQTVCLKPSNHPFERFKPDENSIIDLAAMVPSQVYETLKVPEECEQLRRVRHLLIGGGAVDRKMQEQLQDFPHAVWSTYGMTETLSHIALRRLNGPERSDWYTPFEGVSVALSDEGCLVIHAPAVYDGPLVTHDIAIVQDGRFRILGRSDNVICSGGVKIQMEEVERLLQLHTPVPFIISKAPDAKLGEQVVMLTESSDIESLSSLCQKVLPRYWQPRRILTVPALPLTETSKAARKVAEQMAREMGSYGEYKLVKQ